MKKAPEEMNIIAIDPSMRSSGVFEMVARKGTSYAIQRTEDRIALLGWYARHFAKKAKERAWDVCLIEDYSFGSQSSAVTKQAEIGGIIRACFSACHIPIVEIPIQTWKALTKIRLPKSTVAEKREYLNECLRRFDFTFSTTDECDAFYLFWSARECSRGRFTKGTGSKVRNQLEALGIWM